MENCEQEVRIKLKSTRYEVEASLFGDGDEDMELSIDLDREPEVMEMNVIGKKTLNGGRFNISYAESEITGMEGSTTSVSFETGAPEIVSMIREGTVSTTLVFEQGKRHHCVYNTPIMPFEVCVHTMKVENLLSTMGILNLDYIVEIRGAQAERTKFTMQIL